MLDTRVLAQAQQIPDLVLVGDTLKDAIAKGLTEYDFLRGTETYKSDWVTKQRRVHADRSAGRRFTQAEKEPVACAME